MEITCGKYQHFLTTKAFENCTILDIYYIHIQYKNIMEIEQIDYYEIQVNRIIGRQDERGS